MTSTPLSALVTIIVAAVSSAAMWEFAKGLVERARGRPGRRRSDLDKMAAERDREAAERRILQEELSLHRRIIIEAPCLGPDALPPYPASIRTMKERRNAGSDDSR